ncbi:thiopurine S-methyltransferase [Zooshikella sp. RANM57]|uniref:thiopurine S-methyltransferase n=1 Tax=Zooshikella sp. RANM57 TaxID=3425863 RepID=UPI003D6F30F3
MNPHYWLNRWQENEIAFHEAETNPGLTKYFKTLTLKQSSRVFVPLCGKTLDIAWLLANGYHITGIDLSEVAIKQLFITLGVQANIINLGKVTRYSAQNIDIFVGNIFDLSYELLGAVDGIYDRAALVALPKEMRQRYTAHLKTITNNAPQLLISYEYNQSLMEGPPFFSPS